MHSSETIKVVPARYPLQVVGVMRRAINALYLVR